MKHWANLLGSANWSSKAGVEQRSEVIGMLSAELFKMSTSEEMAAYIANLTGEPFLTRQEKFLKNAKRTMIAIKKFRLKNIKSLLFFSQKPKVYGKKQERRSDFAMLSPYLEKLVEMTKRFITYWGYKENKYNVLLDMYEPGITVEVLD